MLKLTLGTFSRFVGCEADGRGDEALGGALQAREDRRTRISEHLVVDQPLYDMIRSAASSLMIFR